MERQLECACWTALLLLAALGCSERPKEDLAFRVDESLLGPPYSNESLGMAFRPPKGWTAIPDTSLDQIRPGVLAAPEDAEGIRTELVAFFLEQNSGRCCCLSALKGSGGEPFSESLLNHYRDLLGRKFPESQIRETRFARKGLDIVQYLIMSQEVISFKLVVFGAEDVSQLDYIVPAGRYRDTVRMIESSMGSLKSLAGRR